MVYGVDGCRDPKRSTNGAWLVVAFSDQGEVGSAAVVEAFAMVLDKARDGELILVDIPIGLCDHTRPTRTCDQEARRLIGPRRSSVFPAPSRAALLAADYREANERNQR